MELGEKRLKKALALFLACAALAAAVLPTLASAASGGASSTVIVADTRRLSGFQAWIGNLYNESHAYFTVTTIVLIPLMAIVLGLTADFVMGKMGINLRSRQVSEE